MKHILSLAVAASLLLVSTPSADAAWLKVNKDRSVDKVATKTVSVRDGCRVVDRMKRKDVVMVKHVKIFRTVWHIEKVKTVDVVNGERTVDVVKVKTKSKAPRCNGNDDGGDNGEA